MFTDPNTELINLIALVSGILLSLALAYVKGLRTWYAGLAEENKGLIAVGLSALSAAIIWALSCVPIQGEPLLPLIGCTDGTVRELLYAVGFSILGNVGTYITVTKNRVAEDVREIKALKDLPPEVPL